MLICCTLFLFFVVNVQSAPVRDFALIYLTRFGYFDSVSSAELFSDATFQNALLEFQSSAGLNITGNLDDETLLMMSKPRCGFKDTVGSGSNYRSKRYALQGSSWRGSNLKYKVSKYPHRLQKREIDQEIARAFSAWSEHTDLIFTPSNYEADIDIKFEEFDHGDENPFDGRGGVLAHANFPINGGGVHFDASEDWGINSTNTNKKNFYKTAAHEIGHALGLGHSDVLQSLMAPFDLPTKSGTIMSVDDVLAIQSLYGKKSDKPSNIAPNKPHDSSLCKLTKVDTMFTDNSGNVYILKDDSCWKVSQNGTIFNGYPRKTSSEWPQLPTPVDAAFTDVFGKTYFFKGAEVWRYSGNRVDIGFPKKIAENFKGIPNNLDAAFIWGGNGKLYFFKGARFWKCNVFRKMCYTTQKPISNWKDIPDNIDAVLQLKNSYTYFFKGDSFYKFDNNEFSVVEDIPTYPRSMAKWWFDCK